MRTFLDEFYVLVTNDTTALSGLSKDLFKKLVLLVGKFVAEILIRYNFFLE